MLTHVARNADAMINLLTWARTGVRTPAYASDEQRLADVEAGAGRSPAAIRADVVDASDRLAKEVRMMPEAAWSARIVNRQGRQVPASIVPWMRAREVWIHAVDLDVGASFGDFPGPMLAALLADVTAAMAAKPDCPPLRLVAGSGQVWTVGDPAAGVTVTGPASELAAWLLGRSRGKQLRADGSRRLPIVPPWL